MSGVGVQAAKAESKTAWMNMRNRDRYFLNAAIILAVAGSILLVADMYLFDNESDRRTAVHARYDEKASTGPEYVAPESGWDTFIKITTWCAAVWIVNYIWYWTYVRGLVAKARWCDKQRMMGMVSLGWVRFWIITHCAVSFIISVFSAIVFIHGMIQMYKPNSLRLSNDEDQLAYNYLIILWVGALVTFIGYFASAVLYALHAYKVTIVCKTTGGYERTSSKAMMGQSRMSQGMQYANKHMY